MITPSIAATEVEPYFEGEFVGHFVYCHPEYDQVLIWAPNMIQFA